MSNALLALLYSSASSASASASTPQPPDPPPSSSQPEQQQQHASTSSASITPTEAKPQQQQQQQQQPPSASLSASNSLLALLTPPAAPATPAPLPQQPSAPPAPAPTTTASAPPFSLLDALNKPPPTSSSAPSPRPQAPLPPPPPPPAQQLQKQQQQQQPPPPSAPPTANSLLAALFNPRITAAGTFGPSTPPTPSPAQQNVSAPTSQMAFLSSLQAPSPSVESGRDAEKRPLEQVVPPLLHSILTPSRASPVSAYTPPVQSKVDPVAQATTGAGGQAQATTVPSTAAESTLPAPKAVESSKTEEKSALGPRAEDKKKDTPTPERSLPTYVPPKNPADRLPIQRASHQITKHTTADPRTAGLSLLPAASVGKKESSSKSNFHLDLTRLQPAGVDSLYTTTLPSIGIALFPAAQASAAAAVGAVPTPKKVVGTLPSPIPSTPAGLATLTGRNAGAIVLYTLSRARIRVVHRETGARAMLSPPPSSSYALSSNAKVIRLVTGSGARSSMMVVAAIVQDGLRVEEGGGGGMGGEKVLYYLCAWGLSFHFGRVVGESGTYDVDVRCLLMASLPPAVEELDQDPASASASSSATEFPPPGLVWETDPPRGAGVGAYGSLLLRASGEGAQLWRVDVERCECRTGFALEVLQKGKGAVRLGSVDPHSIFAAQARSDTPVLISLEAVNDASGAAILHFVYVQERHAKILTLHVDLPQGASKSTSISFFAALPGVEAPLAIIGLNRNTHILLIRLPASSSSKHDEAELLASWMFDAPAAAASTTNSTGGNGNLLALDAEHTHTLVLAQPERMSLFVLPLGWAMRASEEVLRSSVGRLRWTECAVPEPMVDFVLDAVCCASEGEGVGGGEKVELAVTASWLGGVHIVKIPVGVLERGLVVDGADGHESTEAVVPAPAEAEAVNKIAEELGRALAVSDAPPAAAPAPAAGSHAVPLDLEKSGAAESKDAVAGKKGDAERTAIADAPLDASGFKAVSAKPVVGNDVAPMVASAVASAPPPPAEKDVSSNGAPVSATSTPATPQAPAASIPATVLAAPTPQRVGSPANKGRAAKVAAAEMGKATGSGGSSSRSRTGSQVKKEDVANAAVSGPGKSLVPVPLNGSGSAHGASNGNNGTAAGAGPGSVDLGPVMSLLKQQIAQVVLPEVKTSTRQAVQDYMGNTLPEAVLAALPHELHRFLLRPDLSAHLIRTITAGILPDVRRTAVDTVTKVLAPEFEDVFGGVERRLLEAVESEMVHLRKEVIAEQGDAMVQTEGLVKDMSARMVELRSAVLGLNAANARMEKVLLRLSEREERREAEHAEERARLLELVGLQQRKMEGMETSFGQQVGKLQSALEEHRSAMEAVLQQKQQQQPQQLAAPPPPQQQQPRRSGHDEWGGMLGGLQRSWGGPPPSILSPPPLPPHSASHSQMDFGQAPPPPGPEYFVHHPPPPPGPSGAGSFSFPPPGPPPIPPPGVFAGGPPAPWTSSKSSTPIPQPPPPQHQHQHQPQPQLFSAQRAIPEDVEGALIQALGAPGIEQDPTPLKDTLHTLYARHGGIRDVFELPPAGPEYQGDPSADEVSQPVLLALVHRLAMALDARARLGPNPPVSLVLAGTGGALEVTLAVPWLEAAAPRLKANDPRIEKQYHAVVVLIREALWRAVQGLKGGPDGWWDETRAKEHILNYLWAQR
ncbi:unnamed protein product [Tilletia controversa]|nr:unnamed protein product [Tilletia controversa]CAD6923065.1 unnamed protein product [Tilletia controversa]CAD6952891.1 unnamed protein product [Tilletia controversa]CAD6976822.1 unnamed protein product [Tilletia controversa]